MKKKKVVLLLSVGLISLTLGAQKKATEHWDHLFNGKDFKGWKQLNGKAKYEVKNGEIVGTTVANTPNSFLATEKSYCDFILEFEFKLEQEMNSGVQFRSERKPNFKMEECSGINLKLILLQGYGQVVFMMRQDVTGFIQWNIIRRPDSNLY